MPRRSAPLPALLLALLAALTGGPAAEAAPDTFDARLGDEYDRVLPAGTPHVFRLDLVAGTSLDIRIDDADAPVAASLLGPAGDVLASDQGTDLRLRTTTTAGGVHRLELTASASTPYELRIEGDAPQGGTGGGPVTGAGTVHLDVPRGATVRIEARRRSGAAPEISAVRDGLGRALVVHIVQSRRNRVRLAPVPVSAAGGLDVDVRGAGGADGSYDVRFRISDEDDDGPGSGDDDHAPRRLVLALAPGADAEAVAASLGYELKEDHGTFIVVETPEGREGFEDDDAAFAHDSEPDVISAEPDALLGAPEGTQSNALILGSEYGRADFANQPALASIRAAAAQRRASGAGVVVAVLDTGVDAAHEALAGHVLAGRDFVSGDDDPSEETNGIDDDGDGATDEGFGHGTFVAGLVLAVAPEAQVLPVRVLDTDARGTASGIAAAIEWAVAQGADVVNLSLATGARSGVLADAVRYALGNGAVVVAATGNGADPAAVAFPAAVGGVVAVTSTDASGAPADFANGGTATTLAAPGDALLGPVPPNAQGASYGVWSGTSFSSALASGGAALLLDANPSLRPPQVLARFRAAARRPRTGLTPAERRRLGRGRLDLGRLVR